MVFNKIKFFVGALITWIVCVTFFCEPLLFVMLFCRKAKKLPGHINGKMHLGPLVRYYTILVATSESLLSMLFEEGQKTLKNKKSAPSGGEDANEQFQNFCENKIKQRLTCQALAKWNSIPANYLHNLCEGLRKRQWTKLCKNQCGLRA